MVERVADGELVVDDQDAGKRRGHRLHFLVALARDWKKIRISNIEIRNKFKI